ncbi:hypothetical protein ALP93_200388 [Pseudomonas syringae pv. helianthi]|nr:hypothetical protein ALP93_200388 [Pseudomonas syringae pv. helianthi]
MRVWRALKLALCFAFCQVPGAGFNHAAGLDLTRQVAKVVVVAADGFVTHLAGIAAQRPACGHGFGQLEVRRLLVEIGLFERVIDRAGLFHVIALGGGFLGQQVKAVEAALDGAHHLIADDQAFGGAVLIVATDAVQVVFTVVFPDQPGGVVAEKIVGIDRVVSAIAIAGPDRRLTLPRVAHVFGDSTQGRTREGTGEQMPGVVIARGFVSTAGGPGVNNA